MTPENGTKNTNETVCGSIVGFNCSECYELKGQEQLLCLPNKTWNGETPVCDCRCHVKSKSIIIIAMFDFVVKYCPILMTPVNGTKNSNSRVCGSTVDFSCDECYELEGNSTVSCLPNQTWSGEEPTCTCQFIFLLNDLHLLESV